MRSYARGSNSEGYPVDVNNLLPSQIADGSLLKNQYSNLLLVHFCGTTKAVKNHVDGKCGREVVIEKCVIVVNSPQMPPAPDQHQSTDWLHRLHRRPTVIGLHCSARTEHAGQQFHNIPSCWNCCTPPGPWSLDTSTLADVVTTTKAICFIYAPYWCSPLDQSWSRGASRTKK